MLADLVHFTMCAFPSTFRFADAGKRLEGRPRQGRNMRAEQLPNPIRSHCRGVDGLSHLAVVVVDIVGSTRALQALGPQRYAELIREFRRRVGECADEFGVVPFVNTGDGFILTSSRPSCALDTARAILHDNQERRHRYPVPIELRAAVHCGPIYACEDGLFGVALHTACELGDTAAAGTIWVSDAVASEVRELPSHRERLVHRQSVELAKSGPCVVWGYRWTPTVARTTSLRRPTVSSGGRGQRSLVVTRGGGSP